MKVSTELIAVLERERGGVGYRQKGSFFSNGWRTPIEAFVLLKCVITFAHDRSSTSQLHTWSEVLSNSFLNSTTDSSSCFSTGTTTVRQYNSVVVAPGVESVFDHCIVHSNVNNIILNTNPNQILLGHLASTNLAYLLMLEYFDYILID